MYCRVSGQVGSVLAKYPIRFVDNHIGGLLADCSPLLAVSMEARGVFGRHSDSKEIQDEYGFGNDNREMCSRMKRTRGGSVTGKQRGSPFRTASFVCYGCVLPKLLWMSYSLMITFAFTLAAYPCGSHCLHLAEHVGQTDHEVAFLPLLFPIPKSSRIRLYPFDSFTTRDGR